MRFQRLLFVGAFALLGGCVAGVGEGRNALEEGLVCEPEWSIPLRLITGSMEEVGTIDVTTDEDEIVLNVTAAEGWEIGDAYAGAGTSPATLVWYATNTEPWLTGYQSSVEIRMPLGELGLSCDSVFKLMIQIYVREVGTTTRLFASGYGTQPPTDPIWGWWDWYTVCCADDGCTYTQGYWKNHPEAWPVTSLVIGGRTYDAAALSALLAMQPSGDISIALAHQLIAALLNVANGATAPSALADAQAWMTSNGTGPLPYGIAASSEAGQAASMLNDELDAFNNGDTGPGHCGD